MGTTYDVLIIGAGIVGLATAYQLLEQKPSLRICILEKENKVAAHQSGHNSGVIHSGIYYLPNSEKAINCRRGYDMLLSFCDKHEVPYDICGKVIVATQKDELPFLNKILERGIENQLDGIRKITAAELKEKEPHVKGVAAVWVPQTGIIDYKEVAKKYAELVQQKNAKIIFEAKVINIRHAAKEQVVETKKGNFNAKIVIACAGLYSDKLAAMSGIKTGLKIIPFRGEYYQLIKEKEYLARNLIYPVPNPAFPFLGVHFTRMMKGGIEAGPSAVLAFKREGYSRWDFDAKELLETLSFSGFRQIAFQHWRYGLGELHRSFSKKAFVKALQHLIPVIKDNDLERGNAGVRAMACDENGDLIDDFRIFEIDGAIHLCNAPSPAATASLSIGKTLVEKTLKKLG